MRGIWTLAVVGLMIAGPAVAADARYQAGLEQLKMIDGEAGLRVVETLNAISPDLGRYIVEHAFGEIYARPGLDIKDKELAVVGALTAMGNASPQLKVHIAAALHVGCTPQQIAEVVLQMSLYAGFPAALNGMIALKDVLAEQGMTPAITAVVPPSDRHGSGLARLAELDPAQAENLQKTFERVAPDLTRLIVDFGFGEVLTRPGLTLVQRERVTIAALMAMGTAPAQLRFHIKGGLKAGITQDEIREVAILMSVYAGFPAAINGSVALNDVLETR